MITKLSENINGVTFNGNSAIAAKSLYTVLSVSLPQYEANQSLLQFLDSNHISVSGGSACSSGSASHVLRAIGNDPFRDTIRFSFSKYNTPTEIDFVVNKLAGLYNTIAA